MADRNVLRGLPVSNLRLVPRSYGNNLRRNIPKHVKDACDVFRVKAPTDLQSALLGQRPLCWQFVTSFYATDTSLQNVVIYVVPRALGKISSRKVTLSEHAITPASTITVSIMPRWAATRTASNTFWLLDLSLDTSTFNRRATYMLTYTTTWPMRFTQVFHLDTKGAKPSDIIANTNALISVTAIWADVLG